MNKEYIPHHYMQQSPLLQEIDKKVVDASPEKSLEEELYNILASIGIPAELHSFISIRIPKEEMQGDRAFHCGQLASFYKKSPQHIANDLAEKIKVYLTQHSLGNSFTNCVAVAGFVNLSVNYELFTNRVVSQILDQGVHYGSEQNGQYQKIILDYSAPNIAKPFGIGHLRSTVIGDALAKVYTFLGYDVVRVNHIGDWGTQFGKQMYAIKTWGNEQAIDDSAEPVKELVKLYVRFHEEADEDPTIEDEGRKWFQLLEAKDPEAVRLWKKCIAWSEHEYERIYTLLGISFDYTLGESFYEPFLAQTIDRVQQAGITTESHGAHIFNLESEGLGTAIFIKSDGTSIYLTRDISTALYRLNTMRADSLLYVVGQEQTLHFQQLFAVIQKLGYEIGEKAQHVAFGHYRLADGKMSTRKGKIILLDDVITQAITKSSLLVNERSALTHESEKDKLIMDLAIGALKWNDLKLDPVNTVLFDIDEVLTMEGNSAPYVMYTHARAQSLLTKAGYTNQKKHSYLITAVAEKNLTDLLAQFPDVVRQVLTKKSLSGIVHHLFFIAQEFNRLYHANSIISEKNMDIQATRLELAAASQLVLHTGLRLLGINPPNRM